MPEIVFPFLLAFFVGFLGGLLYYRLVIAPIYREAWKARGAHEVHKETAEGLRKLLEKGESIDARD